MRCRMHQAFGWTTLFKPLICMTIRGYRKAVAPSLARSSPQYRTVPGRPHARSISQTQLQLPRLYSFSTVALGEAHITRNSSADSVHAGLGTGWHPLEEPLIWQGTESEAIQGADLPQTLNPPWKVILLSDGSVTRHLQLMTNLEVKVECLEMRDLPEDASGLPPGVESIPGPLLQRQVFLRRPESSSSQENGRGKCLGTPLVYAASWWNAAEARQYLQQREQPIWVSLQGTELRRDIQRVCYGGSPFLEKELGVVGPFWGRHYVFWHGGKPLTVIYEVFSPQLEQYLGPISGS